MAPAEWGLLKGRALAYYYEQQFDRAITDLTDAARLDPNDSSTFYNRAIAYSAKRDHDRAIADYTTAIKLDPGRLADIPAARPRNRPNAIMTARLRITRRRFALTAKIAMHFTTAPQRIAPSRTSTMPLRIIARQ
jgi:tetratricopeptide (TPR) repeat protein